MDDYEITVGYIEVEDLIRNGGLGCNLMEEKPEKDHVEVLKDLHYGAYRGRNLVRYRGERIASEWRLPPRGMEGEYEREGPTIGLLDDAAFRLQKEQS